MTVLVNLLTLPVTAAGEVIDQALAFGPWKCLATATVMWVSALWVHHHHRRTRRGLPPGPLGIPYFGNLFQLSTQPEIQLTQWAKKYGGLYSLKLGARDVMILTHPKIVKDLCVTRGNIYSSRMDWYILGDVLLENRGVGATPYNDKWRLHRKVANSSLSLRALNNFNPIVDAEGTVFVHSLLHEGALGQTPVNPLLHCARFPMNSMLSIIFGWRTSGADDPLIRRAMAMGEDFSVITGMTQNAVDFLPLLKLFPLENVKRARKLKQEFFDCWGGMLKDLEVRIDDGEEIKDCLAKGLIELYKQKEMDWTDIVMFCTGIMLAGIETTAGSIAWLLSILSHHPEIQRKAQAELDAVVGRDRMPTLADMNDLQYIRAMLKEVLRFRNPFPQGIPHFTTEDDTYEGFHIPAKSVVMINVHGLHFDEERYPNADQFQPERFLHDRTNFTESANCADPMQRDQWSFGAGRRICAGMHLAEREMYLAISRALWAFDIVGLEGEMSDLDKFEGELPRSPVAFRVKFVPRDAKVAGIIDLAHAGSSAEAA
ncbi:hypothetical protein HDU89_004629 [Geranomyces variabilis]|nr:hypothetical protein HDU89_004629 [Geranomyces variabilis]